MFFDATDETATYGQILVSYQRRQADALFLKAKIYELKGCYNCLGVFVENADGRGILGSMLAKASPSKMGIVFFKGDTGKIRAGVSVPEGSTDVDATALATLYPGGGGHKGAAGFTITETEFKLIDSAARRTF